MTNNKTNKKRMVLIALLVVLLIGGCVGGWILFGNKPTEPKTSEKPLPATTSAEAQLYIADADGKLTVVDFDGKPVSDHVITAAGHIANKDGEIVVPKDKAAAYVFVSEIKANVERIELTEGGERVELKIAVLPEDATNPACTVTVADAEIARVADGTVEAVAVGETELTVTAGDAILTIPVTVAKAETGPEDPTEPAEPVTPEDPAPAPAPTPAPQPTPAPTPGPTPTPHTHKYTDTRTEPTCTADGKIVSKCSCGDTKTTVIPRLGHDYKETSHTAATCTQEGKVVSKCSRCGDAKTETTAALGHDHSQPVYETRTYEVVTGYEEHAFCHGCGKDVTDILKKDGSLKNHYHETGNPNCMGYYTDWIEVKETVTEQILTGYKCSRCGDIKPMPQ